MSITYSASQVEAITATRQRVYGWEPPTTTFTTPAGLDAWLSAQGITPPQYAQILVNLGYTPAGGALAITSGTLTGEKILEEYEKL
jgi:ABC-type nitrate/sulfonate/bicarbonate transport system substrate-binding protein